jgi:hypothetical protein
VEFNAKNYPPMAAYGAAFFAGEASQYKITAEQVITIC